MGVQRVEVEPKHRRGEKIKQSGEAAGTGELVEFELTLGGGNDPHTVPGSFKWPFGRGGPGASGCPKSAVFAGLSV